MKLQNCVEIAHWDGEIQANKLQQNVTSSNFQKGVAHCNNNMPHLEIS